MKTNIIATFAIALFIISSFGLSVHKMNSSTLAQSNRQQRSSKEETMPKMTSREKVAKWKGEKVTFLGSLPLWCSETPKSSLRRDKYRGQTGVLIETTSKSDTDHSLVIQLDKTNQKVIWNAYWELGFQSELESAKTWIGRSLWSKGPHTIQPDARICLEEADRQGRSPLHNIEKVTITRAEFGDSGQTILFFVRTEDGREGWLDGWDGWDRFDDKYHIYFDSDWNKHPYSYHFHLDDPRKKHPKWSPTIWKVIERGRVAIGMTEEMAYLACGKRMLFSGTVLSSSGKEVSEILSCNGREFMVKNGKVIKYVD